MFNHTLKLALRNFVRDKQFAVLNLLGLSLGTAAFFLAMQYASFEMSYDTFHEEADNIFRVAHLERDGNHIYEGVGSFYGIGPKALEEFPEVRNFTRLHRADGMVSWANPEGEPVSYHETNAYYADQSFFDIFSFPLIQGSRRDLLKNPNSVLISESAAKKYFGDKDPMGEVLSLTTEWKGGNYTVEGVFADVPTNSHLSFDFIFPITELLTNFQFDGKDWYWINFYTYLLLEPSADVASVGNGLTDAVDRHIHFLFQTDNYEFNLALQPVTDINLHSNLDGEVKETGKWPSIKAFIIAAFFTIVLAWLNYINLTTARATRRAKEIGVKKVMGSSKSALVGQFLLESIITNMIAVFLATGLLLAFFPTIERWFGITLQFDWGLQYRYWLLFASLFVLGTLGSSFYPAYHLSSLKIVHSLKGQTSDRGKSGWIRKGMVMMQFTLSLLLLTGSLVIYEQIALMKSRDLGMDISNKLVIKAPRETKTGYWRSLRNFKEEALKRSTFTQATTSFEVPGRD
ncbi:MAG: ABC transporter permease, partial [Bacteroidota bacterium]